MRRACKHPLNSAKPLQQLHRRSETDCPSFRTARILSSSLEALRSLCLMQLREQIALHVVHHARLAKSPLRYPSGFMQPFGHVCGVCCPQAPHSILNFLAGIFLLRHPHAGFGAYRRAAQKARRKNRKDINAFVPRKAFCSSALMQTLEQVSGRSPHRFK